MPPEGSPCLNLAVCNTFFLCPIRVSPTSALSLFLSPDTVGLLGAGAARRLGFPCRAAPPALSGGSILAHPSPLLRLKLFVAPHLVAPRLDVVVDDPFAVPRRRISSLLWSLSVVVARRRRGAPTLLARREAPPLGWREAPPQRLGSTFVRQPRRTPKSCHLGGFNYSPRGRFLVM